MIIDRAVFHWINGWPDWLSPFLTDIITNGTHLWPVRIMILGFLIYCFTRKDLRWAAILALLAWPIANELCDIAKEGLQLYRPWVVLEHFNQRVGEGGKFGSASAHSANMACVAAAFWFFNRPIAITWTVVAFLTGISRIYVGAHFPSQVLFGWTIGCAVGVAGALIYRAIVAKWFTPSQAQEGDQSDQNSREL